VKICPVGDELFNAEGQKDGRRHRHDEATGSFSPFLERT